MASRTDIIELRGEAEQAGDTEQVKVCDRALDPTNSATDSQAAWEECERVINEFRCQHD
jgi:hypothetical protein